jgi:hypothetical protein
MQATRGAAVDVMLEVEAVDAHARHVDADAVH